MNKELNEILNRFNFEVGEIKKLDDEMTTGLAMAYKESGFRKYMNNAIQIAIYNAAMLADNEKEGLAAKSRLITLKSLLDKSEQCFKKVDERMQKLKKNAKG